MLLASTMPALAVSRITNTYSASDYSISTGQVVSFSAKSSYEWIIIPNPYPSNFYTEVNYRHFGTPSTITRSNLPSKSWVYDTDGYFTGTDPSYYYYSGRSWILPTENSTLGFRATAKSAASGNRRRSGHGQNTALDGTISYGGAAYIYTTHN